jgi:hypothetical protein
MLDCPPADQADPAAYVVAIDQYVAAFPGPPARGAVISSLPESMAVSTREMCLAAGIMPLQGQREALEALNLAGEVGETWASGTTVELRIPGQRGAKPAALHSATAAATNAAPTSAHTSTNAAVHAAPATVRAPTDATGRAAPTSARTATSVAGAPTPATTAAAGTSAPRVIPLTEHAGKAALAAFGVNIPRSRVVAPRDVASTAQEIGFPVVIKASGAHLEHKSELGAVIVNVRTTADAEAAAQRLSKLSDTLLVEQMISDGVAEILVGMTVDAQFGQVLVIGAGGILTELLRDSATLLPPFTPTSIEAALNRLKVSKLLASFRGKPAGDIPALVETVLACTRYAEANLNALVELDINPVIVRPAGLGAVAVDALIRLSEGAGAPGLR